MGGGEGKASSYKAIKSNEGVIHKMEPDPSQRCIVVGSNGLRL